MFDSGVELRKWAGQKVAIFWQTLQIFDSAENFYFSFNLSKMGFLDHLLKVDSALKVPAKQHFNSINSIRELKMLLKDARDSA